MTTALKLASDASFEDVIRIVHKLCGPYLAAGFDRGEVFSAAGLGFSQAFSTFDKDLGVEFRTWVWWKVEKRLLDLYKQLRKRKDVTGLELDLVPKEEPTFNLEEWLEELSDDAREVAMMVFQTPTEVRLVMKELGEENPANFRQAVRELLAELGWSANRIRRTFMEIRSKL